MHRRTLYIIEICLSYILGNGHCINFCYDNWFHESPLTHKTNPNKGIFINKQAKLSCFITVTNIGINQQKKGSYT